MSSSLIQRYEYIISLNLSPQKHKEAIEKNFTTKEIYRLKEFYGKEWEGYKSFPYGKLLLVPILLIGLIFLKGK